MFIHKYDENLLKKLIWRKSKNILLKQKIISLKFKLIYKPFFAHLKTMNNVANPLLSCSLRYMEKCIISTVYILVQVPVMGYVRLILKRTQKKHFQGISLTLFSCHTIFRGLAQRFSSRTQTVPAYSYFFSTNRYVKKEFSNIESVENRYRFVLEYIYIV